MIVAHGADVLWITSPNLPALPMLDVDTSRGKRTTQLDLNDRADRETFASLIKGTDVVLQSYRPGGLAEKKRLRRENRQRIRDQNFMKTQ